MKAAESKTTTTAQHLQPKAESQEPFFQKERTDSVLEQGNTSFFSPQPQPQAFFSRPSIQTKLTIGQSGDKYEQEADSMADQVVQRLAENNPSNPVSLNDNGQVSPKIQRKPIFESNAEPAIQAKSQPSTAPTTPLIQSKCADCEQEEKLQKKEAPGLEEQVQMKPIFESNGEPPEMPLQPKLEHTPFLQKQCAECAAEEETPGLQKQADSAASPAATPSLESRLSSSRGGGSPLPENTRSQMEGAFGSDFSGVRVHTDSSAVQMNKELGAQAFTHGSDLYFGAGKFQPGTAGGDRLLAHELVHVGQQGESALPAILKDETEEPAPEVEAGEPATETPLPYNCREMANLLKTSVASAAMTLLQNRDNPGLDYQAYLFETIKTNLGNIPELSPADVELLRVETEPLLHITVPFGSEETDYGKSIVFLTQHLGAPPEVQAVGGSISYGARFFIHTISGEIADYLVPFILNRLSSTDPPLPCSHLPFEQLSTYFADYIAQWGRPHDLLELEIIGSIEGLIELRSAFNTSTSVPDNIRLGAEIGRLSRLILLLDSSFEQYRDTLMEDFDRTEDTSILESTIEEHAAQIEALRRQAETETGTLSGLGNERNLLQGRMVDNIQNIYVIDIEDTGIEPDAAFPNTTDETTLRMMRDLSTRVDSQAAQLRTLHQEVIPDNPSYSLEEFERVYQQWVAFFSPTARDLNPYYRQVNELYTGLSQAFSYGGAEGGFGRWLLMRFMSDHIGERELGGANLGFSNFLSEGHISREQELTGDATNVQYRAGELMQGGSTWGMDETVSRETAINQQITNTTQGFEALHSLQSQGRHIESEAIQRRLVTSHYGAPVFLLRTPQQQVLWNYLITSYIPGSPDPTMGNFIHEQQAMPTHTARYLAASTQHYRSVGVAHRPGIGDRSVRLNGLEQGRAASSHTYLEGSQGGGNIRTREADNMRTRLEGHRSAANLGDRTDFSRLATERLVAELEAYLNRYFASTDDATRLGGIIKISVYEHRGDQAFFQNLTPLALLKAIGISAGIAAAVAMLRYIPYIGYALQYSISRLLRRYGIAADVNSVVTIAGFLNEAATARNFDEARVWAYFAHGTLNEIGQLLQGFAAGTIFDSLQFAGRQLIRTRPHGTANEVMRDLEILTREPEMREAIREDLQARRDELAGQQTSDPELEMIDQVLTRLDQSLPDAPIPQGGRAVDNLNNAPSLIRSANSFQSGAELHDLSIRPWGGKMTVIVCSVRCGEFLAALEFLRPNLRRSSDALRELDVLAADTRTLQEGINNGTVNPATAQAQVNVMVQRLQALGQRHPEIVDSIANRHPDPDTSVSQFDYMVDRLQSTTGGSTTTRRYVQNDNGEIVEVDARTLPDGLHPGQGFMMGNSRLTYVGDAQARYYAEEGFAHPTRNTADFAQVRASHDMGVEQGRLKAAEEGLTMVPWNPPDQYIGVFGKGIDDIGRRGNIFYILEWKGGRSELKPGQMGDEWVGRKLAEFTIYYQDAGGVPGIHPDVQKFLRAADAGRLRGRGYSTQVTPSGSMTTERITEGPLAGGERTYDGATVRAAFDQRLAQLRRRYNL